MLNKLDPSVKLYILIFITAASLLGLGLYGIRNVKKMDEDTRTLYADRVVSMHQLANVRFQYIAEIIPAALQVKNHILTFEKAEQHIHKARKIIDSNWHDYKLTYLTPEENILSRQTDSLMNRAGKEVETLENILAKKDTVALEDLIKKQTLAGNTLFLKKLTQLIDLQANVGKQIFQNSGQTYSFTSRNFVLLIIFALLISLALSFYIIRQLIKDLLKRKDRMKLNEQKYHSILQNASDAIYLADNTGNFIDLSESMCKMLGYSKEELMQLNFSDIVEPESLKTNPIERPTVPGRPIFKERTLITRAGKKLEVEINGQRVSENSLMGVARNVTERKRMETELRESELKFRTLAEKSMLGVFITQNKRFLYANPRFAEIFGYEPQELMDLSTGVIDTIYAEESRAMVREKIRARDNGETEGAHYEAVGLKKDGTKTQVEFYGNRVTINGQPAAIGTAMDITERKRTETGLKDAELKFRTLVERSMMGVYISQHEKFLYVNPRFAEIFGYQVQELLDMAGSVIDTLFGKESRDIIRANIQARYKGEVDSVHYQITGKRKDGSINNLEIYGNIVTINGQQSIIGTILDITERKQAEGQRINAEEELKKSERNLAQYNRELTLLNKINDIILRNQDELALYQQVCNCIVQTGGYKLAWVCYKPEVNADQTIIPLVAAGACDYLKEIKISMDDPELSKGPTTTALLTGKTFVNKGISPINYFGPWLATARKHSINSSLVLVLKLGNDRTGALTIYSEHDNAFDEHEVDILERLAASLSIAVQGIENRSILIESENRFRRAFEDSSIGMGLTSIEKDSMGRWLKVNKSLCEMLGYTQDELLSRTFMEITHPEDLATDLAAQDGILQGESDTYRIEKRYIHKNGSFVWINLNVSIVRDKDKQPIYLVAQIENITEKVESQIKFQNLVENFIVGVYILQNGKLVYVNSRVLEESGYREEEIVDMPFEKFIYEDDLEFVQQIIDSRTKGLIDNVRYEARIVKKDGQLLWFEILGSTTTYKGAPALMGTMVPIDERKAAEKEIHRLTRLYQFISSINESMLKAEDTDQVYADACRIAVEIGGFQMAWIGTYDEKNDHIIPVTWSGYEEGFFETINVADMKVSESAIPSARAIRERAHFYYNDIANSLDIPSDIKHEMVKRGYLSGVSFPIFVDGEIVAAMVLLMSDPFFFNEEEIELLRDVTDNITYALDKIKIQALQDQSEANLRSIFDSTDVSYLLLDAQYNIISLNQQMKDIYENNVGITLREGDNLVALIRPERRKIMRELYDSVLLSKKPSEYESSFTNDGITKHFAASVFPIMVGDEAIGICISSIDITERKNALQKLKETNKDLQKKKKELEYSNTELEQFAYVASHDLQEPLRMVASFLAQLEKKYGGVLDERGKKYVYFAIDGAKRMRQLILDLLEFSRVGKIESSLEDVNFNNIVNEVLALHRRNIEESKARIQFGELPTLRIYKTPLRQVFQNLLGNALKYHRPGVAPVIEISSKENPTNFEFSVKDNGIGIDPEYFNQIFIIFKRLHNRDEYSGTGMGLAITKKIVENMGGRIWVDSREGEGAIFHFTIPKDIKR